MLEKTFTLTALVVVAVMLEIYVPVMAAGESAGNSTIGRNYTEEEKEQKWKGSLSCFNRKWKNKIDLSKLSGLFYVPYLYAPPYWTEFGSKLCKWTKIVPDSKDRVNYFGGYLNTTQPLVQTYIGQVKYNNGDKVYNLEEHFFATGTTSIFSAVPCAASRHTFMFYIPHLTADKKCIHQTFVFSRNSETMAKDKKRLESHCFDKYFNIAVDERPYAVTGCVDLGLF